MVLNTLEWRAPLPRPALPSFSATRPCGALPSKGGVEKWEALRSAAPVVAVKPLILFRPTLVAWTFCLACRWGWRIQETCLGTHSVAVFRLRLDLCRRSFTSSRVAPLPGQRHDKQRNCLCPRRQWAPLFSALLPQAPGRIPVLEWRRAGIPSPPPHTCHWWAVTAAIVAALDSPHPWRPSPLALACPEGVIPT